MTELKGHAKRLIEQVIEQVKKNRKTLMNCKQHDFSIDLTPERVLGKRWKCAECGGEVAGSEKHWYELGLKHGKEVSRNGENE